MKPVCFFNSTPVWGGGEKWHYDLALQLTERGVPVYVITGPESELFRRLARHNIPCRHMRISNLSFLNPATLFLLIRFFRQCRIDAVIMNLSRDLKIAGIAAKLAGVRKIIYRRGLAKPVRNTALNRWLFGRIITDVLVNSEETKRTMLVENPSLIPQDRITVIYNGLDLNTYDQQTASPIYAKHAGEIVLGNAARLSAQKGQRYLLELAARLQAQGIPFRMLIAGTGELEAELRQYAAALQVDQSVTFVGFQENIKPFMESLDIFILSSLFEGFGYVLVEAMASRKPVVAFDVSSNPEIVVHGHTGFLAEAENLDELTRCVIELAQNETLRQTFGHNARARVESTFDMPRVVEETLALLKK